MKRRSLWMPFLICVAVAIGLLASLKPWESYRKHREEADAARREMQQAERTHADLLRERSRLDSAIGREELAREQGFIKPGERPIEIGP
jgi:hypothetical protein